MMRVLTGSDRVVVIGRLAGHDDPIRVLIWGRLNPLTLLLLRLDQALVLLLDRLRPLVIRATRRGLSINIARFGLRIAIAIPILPEHALPAFGRRRVRYQRRHARGLRQPRGLRREPR